MGAAEVGAPEESVDLGGELSALAFRFAEDIVGCVEMDDLSHRFQQAILSIGMTASASGMISGPRRLNGQMFHFVNWPQDWLALYEARNFVNIDPVPRWAVVSGAPIAWSELVETLPPDDPGCEVYRRAAEWNFTEGLVTPVRGLDGSLGLVSAGGGRGRLSPRERLFLQSISVAVFHRAEAISRSAIDASDIGAINLPNREYLAWDRTSQAMLAVDGAGLIHHLNRPAEQLLLSGGSLRAVAGRLTTSDPRATEALLGLLQRAGPAPPVRQGSGAMTYRGPDGRPAGTITVSPLQGGEGAGPSAVVRISLPEADVDLQADRIRDRFSLTAAEWRVAAALYQGQSPQGLAAMLGISVNTVRVQMRRVFAKTGAHRQTELVAAIRNVLLSPGDA